MSARAWNLRLNLDDFNALAGSMYLDLDRALALQGMVLGANGGDIPGEVPGAFRRGWDLGRKMYMEVLDFQAQQSTKGKVSAEKRRERTGTAQPHKLEPRFDPLLDHGSTNLEPNDNLQSTIPNPQSTNQEQRASARTGSGEASGRMSASDWEPLREHRDLCAIRRADCDLQLARFRERNVGTVDTDQGWGARFLQWIGKAKPERSVTPEAVASPTLDDWMGYAREVSRGKGPNGEAWPKPLAEAGWHENQAKGWRFVQDWRADCNSRALRWSGYEETTMQRNRRTR